MCKQWVLNILVAIDELVNSILGGSPHETISSRLGRNYPLSPLTTIVNMLFFWQKNWMGLHCQSRVQPEEFEDDAIIK